MKSTAENLPFGDGSLDCIITFNAVHHFRLRDFLVEAARVLRDGSLLFIYTRTPEQNRRHVWGRYFPQFCRKETRLYRRDQLEQAVSSVPGLKLRSIKDFAYDRLESLDRLVEKAENRHYSTFWFYSDREFAEALNEFRCNINKFFPDPDQVWWCDENLLLVIEKEAGSI